MSKTPDRIIEFQTDYYNTCGAELLSIASQAERVPQILDIPPIKAIYTKQYHCGYGYTTKVNFPKSIALL
ncbi:MAG: hypothetical protein HRT67_03655 [Flavobacteriaceae bacterium]|nr:hypothetical protein [Flavobacteriaceae bacterium]